MDVQDPPARVRLFIAVEVPQALQIRIGRAQAHLREKVAGAAIKWIPQEQFHLTLKFLGYVERQQVIELTEAARLACSQFAPLKFVVREVGFFPNAQRPRIVWVGMRDAEDKLELLASAVQAATLPFTTEEPAARFSGHITIGRVKELGRPQFAMLRAGASELADQVFGEWTAGECVLMESRLSAKGPTYEVVAKLPLVGE